MQSQWQSQTFNIPVVKNSHGIYLAPVGHWHKGISAGWPCAYLECTLCVYYPGCALLPCESGVNMLAFYGTALLVAGCIVGLSKQFEQFVQGRLRCMLQE